MILRRYICLILLKMNYSFTGHETFNCKNYWLKKGLDHVWNDRAFDSLAVKELGVGKNMVASIKYWLKSFGLIETNDVNTKISKLIFDDAKGKDPYLEDIGSIWLLHFLLVTTEKASIYSLVFNHFRKKKIEFTRDELLKFIISECEVKGFNSNSNSIKKDIGVFIKSYRLTNSKSVEEEFMGLLHELRLLDLSFKSGQNESYKIENKARLTLPPQIVLACALLQMNGSTISFQELLLGINQVGSVFAISSNFLMESIEKLLAIYPKHLTYSDDGGVQVLQLSKSLDSIDVIKKYYGK